MTTPEFTRSKFWRLLETAASEANGDLDALVQVFTEELTHLSPEEIIRSQAILEELIALADRWDLRAATHIINSGSSEEAFDNFRGWLIAQGRSVFEAALDDPESLLAVVESEVTCRPLLNAPAEAYLKRTKKKMPPRDPIEVDPAGEEWEEADLPTMFPRLWEEFGDDD